MNKAVLALTPVVMLAFGTFARVDRAAAEGALPCNALCRAWMGMNDPAPPAATIELHPAIEAVSAQPLPPPPRHSEPDRRTLVGALPAVPLPPHRPIGPMPKTDRALRVVAAAPGAVSARSTLLALALATAPRARAVATPAPLEPVAPSALVPVPGPAMEPVLGAAPRPDTAATPPTSEPLAVASSLAPAAPVAPAAAPEPVAILEPSAAQALIGAQAPEPAEPPASEPAATPAAPVAVEKPTVVAALVPEAPPQIELAPSAPAAALASSASQRQPADDRIAAPSPIPFPPALDVIATLMLTTPARR